MDYLQRCLHRQDTGLFLDRGIIADPGHNILLTEREQDKERYHDHRTGGHDGAPLETIGALGHKEQLQALADQELALGLEDQGRPDIRVIAADKGEDAQGYKG